MSLISNILYRDLPVKDLPTLYPLGEKPLPFQTGHTIYTAFPKETAIIRSTGILALAIFSYIKPHLFMAASSYVILTSYIFPDTEKPMLVGALSLAIGALSRRFIADSRFSLFAGFATTIFAAWTAYTNLYRDNAATNAFHQITG